MEILPAIMPNDYSDLGEKLSLVSNIVSIVQIDVMDGKFVHSRSWPYKKTDDDKDFEKVLNEDEGLPFWENLNFEIDLMVSNPRIEAVKWIKAGASRLVLHIESMVGEDTTFVDELKQSGVEVGIALDMKTPIEVVNPFLNSADFFQLMGIDQDGFQGIPFDEKVLDKIKEMKKNVPSVIISVDGGVSLETAPLILAAGAERLIVGSAIFGDDDPQGRIRDFQNL